MNSTFKTWHCHREPITPVFIIISVLIGHFTGTIWRKARQLS